MPCNIASPYVIQRGCQQLSAHHMYVVGLWLWGNDCELRGSCNLLLSCTLCSSCANTRRTFCELSRASLHTSLHTSIMHAWHPGLCCAPAAERTLQKFGTIQALTRGQTRWHTQTTIRNIVIESVQKQCVWTAARGPCSVYQGLLRWLKVQSKDY